MYVSAGGGILKNMQSQLKRNRIIDELKENGITEIDGQDLLTVKYSKLLKELAANRADRNIERG